jgi:hypothetical protein
MIGPINLSELEIALRYFTIEEIFSYVDFGDDIQADLTSSEDGYTISYSSVSDTHDWSSRVESYDSDFNLLSRIDVDKDGNQSFTSYHENGERASVQRVDVSDVQSWTSLELTWDTAGQIQTVFEVNDDASTRKVDFSDGAKTFQLMEDVGNVFAWDQISIGFDDRGAQSEMAIHWDDGSVGTTTFVNGVAVSTIVFDSLGVNDWTSKEIAYDDSGERTQVDTLMDNGDLHVRTESNGVLVSNQFFDMSGSESWYSRVIEYNQTGTAETTTVTSDLGDVQVYHFVDGETSRITYEDVTDSFIWKTREEIYEAGELTTVIEVMEDGQANYIFFTDGDIEYDQSAHLDGESDSTLIGHSGYLGTEIAPSDHEMMML